MRVLQLIDSLDTGGAERISVNLANVLVGKIEASFLCATRKEGTLKASLSKQVSYLFLNKKKTIDILAIIKLFKFVKKNNINIVHAHSTSFFLATIIKCMVPKIKIVWHDHYGNSEFLKERNDKMLKCCSVFFSQILVVNSALKQWALNHLKTDKVNFLSNFSIQDTIEPQTQLAGKKHKRIVHLANLRPQKNHKALIRAFKCVLKKYPDWTLHCVGKDFLDDYSKQIKRMALKEEYKASIFFYNSKPDITHILSQSDIGVLSSNSEGLPLALLEYGMSNLPVVSTNVGDCGIVISNLNEGILVEPNNTTHLCNAIIKLIDDKNLRIKLADNLTAKVAHQFSKDKITSKVISFYNNIL